MSDETSPALSVVVPCRNAAAHLDRLLDALAHEEPSGAWEVVVVDNCSTDDTRSVAERHAEALPVRVVDASERPGAWYARNVGAQAARGDHLVFLDSDDLFSPGYLLRMTTALASADVVAARLDGQTLNPGWQGESRPMPIDGGLLDHFGFLPYASAGTLGVRRRTFEALGGFAAVPFGEDVDFCWRAQLAGTPLQPVPDATVHYSYRQTLPSMFRQARWYGRAQPLLFRRFRQRGMPQRTLGQALEDWRGLMVQLIHARSKRELAQSLFLLGVYTGRAEGSVRHRVLYL